MIPVVKDYKCIRLNSKGKGDYYEDNWRTNIM
jgi:hypothetical protein